MSQAPLFSWTRRDWLRLGGLSVGALGAWALMGRESKADDEKLLEEATSPYNTVQVTERGSIRTMYFVVDGTRFIESQWNMDHPHSLDLDYSRTMMAGFLLNPRPKRIMMMGLGGGIISNYLFERFDDIEIDAVDIDPEVVRLARKYFGVPDNPRYRTHVEDGRLFVEKAKEPWDMQILDAFRGVFVPFHLKTKEFYEACVAKLSADGVVVANLHNRTKMYPYDRQTLGSVFPQSYPFVAERGNQTTYVGSANVERVGAYQMRRNARELEDKFDFDLLGLAARQYMRRDYAKVEVLRDDFKPGELEQAVERHNETCIRGCKYQAG